MYSGWGKACGKKDGKGSTVEVNSRENNASSKILRAGTAKKIKKMIMPFKSEHIIEKVYVIFIFLTYVCRWSVTRGAGIEIMRKAR